MTHNQGKEQASKRRRGRPVTAGSADTELILDEALKLFARYSYDGVSLNHLSEKTGVATSLFNYHFGSKEGLWQAALKKAYNQLAINADEANLLFKGLDALSYSKSMTRWFILYCAKHPALYQIMAYEMSSRSGRGKWVMEHIAIPLSKRLEFSHNQQVEKGVIKSIPIANWISIILGACNTFFMMKHQIRHQYDIDVYDEEQIAQHADVVVDVLYSGVVRQDSKS